MEIWIITQLKTYSIMRLKNMFILTFCIEKKAQINVKGYTKNIRKNISVSLVRGITKVTLLILYY